MQRNGVQTGTRRMTLVVLSRSLLATLVLSIGCAYAAARPQPAQRSDRVLAEGNPPLTQSMVDQRIAVWESFLEIKINREQRDVLQRAMVEGWTRDKDEIHDTLEDLKFYGEKSEIAASRVANQSAFVAGLRKQPNDPAARQLLEIYDTTHPERKNLMQTRGLDNLVGEWKRVDALLAARGPNNTYYGSTSTDTLILNIFPDGHFKHHWSHSHCHGQSECCGNYGTDVNGEISAQGSNLVLRANSGTALMRNACTPSTNFFKSMNPEPASLAWSVSRPDAGRTRLCLSDRPFGFNFDHKAPAEVVCYEKQH